MEYHDGILWWNTMMEYRDVTAVLHIILQAHCGTSIVIAVVLLATYFRYWGGITTSHPSH